MKSPRIWILVSLLSLLSLCMQAQNRKMVAANKFYESGEYVSAIEKYKKLYTKVRDKSLKAEVAYKTADSYRRINDAKNSISWYRKAIKAKYPDPKAVLYLADELKKLESYEEALEQYQLYHEMVPDDPAGENGIKSAQLSLQWIQKPEAIKVEVVKSLNTKNMDYSPMFYGTDDKTLYFISSREGATGEKLSTASGENFSDIFWTTVDRKDSWSKPVPLVGALNTVFDEGAVSFMPDFRQMYYTHCEQKKKESAGCRIYTAFYKNDSWDDVSEIVIVQDSSVSLGHPAISPDGLTLYFASDLEGGMGGKDIWKVTRQKMTDTWSKPENLGPDVNTPGNELFPYVHADSTLYFSSDYLPGMGGLDIFHYAPDKEGKWVVTNMKNPINSPQDDFGITFDSSGLKGFFSSTRLEKNSDDIFSFEIPVIKFSVVGIVVNDSNNQPLDSATVTMTGSDGSTLEAVTGKDGKFSFSLAAETSYNFVSARNDFFKGTANESTKGLTESKVLSVRIPMQQIKKEVAFEVENIFYDLDKATLRPESMVSLDKLMEFLEFNPNITIELGAHTDFRGSDKYNQDLSQRRAQSVIDYLTKKGIDAKRLQAKGYGESLPRTITEKLAKDHPEFKVGDVLSEDYIVKLPNDEQKDVAHQMNRRTEFRVLSTTFKVDAENFGKRSE